MLLAFPFVVRCGRIKLLLKRWRAAYGDLLLVGVSVTGSRSGRQPGVEARSCEGRRADPELSGPTSGATGAEDRAAA
jgi:hypothetical protein